MANTLLHGLYRWVGGNVSTAAEDMCHRLGFVDLISVRLLNLTGFRKHQLNLTPFPEIFPSCRVLK